MKAGTQLVLAAVWNNTFWLLSEPLRHPLPAESREHFVCQQGTAQQTMRNRNG